MIEYKEHSLPNGLTILANRDTTSRMAAVNILYKVGARNENPERTGFAHLFEHLMFRGTRHVPHFDIPVQQACGENNAFTNNDYTDYYITLPKDNIETAFWLESDRMEGLDITRKALETEKKVVIEEYNQRYLNQPYGDMWLLLREMAYKTHPYRWPTIGLSIEHVAAATLAEVKEFYRRWYNPANAILSVSADISEQQIFEMAGKWFGDLPSPADAQTQELPSEPPQTAPRRSEVVHAVPASAVTIAFRMSGRMDRQFYGCDVMSDLLAGGTSARLYQRLVKERQLFSAINAYITGDIDPGLFVVTGHLHPGITPEQGERGIWDELERLQNEPASEYELEKVKNKFEAGVIFGELNVMNKAMNMAFYRMLGDMSLLNGEVAIFRSIGAEEIVRTAREVFVPERSSTLIYIAEE
ncbi:MAG: insulinase family protein [Rikenellaceae bacterium]|nr:insulinase family protein [Rikenellaceae bacterium]MCL2693330.1 insulinase family protein [Rikenellaceae bacterium]